MYELIIRNHQLSIKILLIYEPDSNVLLVQTYLYELEQNHVVST